MKTTLAASALNDRDFMTALDDVLDALHTAKVGGPNVADDPRFDRIVANVLTNGVDLGDGRRTVPQPADQQAISTLAFEQVEAGEPYDDDEGR